MLQWKKIGYICCEKLINDPPEQLKKKTFLVVQIEEVAYSKQSSELRKIDHLTQNVAKHASKVCIL